VGRDYNSDLGSLSAVLLVCNYWCSGSALGRDSRNKERLPAMTLTRERAEEIVLSDHHGPLEWLAKGFLEGHNAMREKARRLEEALEKIKEGQACWAVGPKTCIDFEPCDCDQKFAEKALADFRREVGECTVTPTE